jgi:hypothetical protein
VAYEILDPTVDPVVEPGTLAPRLTSLEGARIGLWSNMKINADALLDEVEKILREEHGVASTQRGFYNAGRVMRFEEWGDIDGCDAVILTHGD